jgi:putative transcriptional regulator
VDRNRMIKETGQVLSRAGFYISDPDLFQTVNFDIVARRDAMLIIVKVLSNIDALDKDVADQVLLVCKHLNAFPLLVGERSNMNLLEEGVVYLRHGMPVMSIVTLMDYFIEGVPPFVLAGPGGPYVNIDGEELKRVRTAKGISLGTMAKAAGVSRRSIQLYESGGKAMYNVVVKMEEYLGAPIVNPVKALGPVKDVDKDLYRPGRSGGDFAKHVFERFRGLGFVVIPTVKCPFDALSEDKKTLILTGLGQQNKSTVEKAKIMATLSKIAEKDSVMVMSKDTMRQNIEGTPVIAKSELDKCDGPDEVLHILKERKK